MSFFKKLLKLIRNVLQKPSRKRKAKVSKSVSRKSKSRKLTAKTTHKKRKSSLSKFSNSVNTQKKTRTAEKVVVRRKTSSKPIVIEHLILGEVTHYFDKIQVCVIRMDAGVLKRGDQIRLITKSGSFDQMVNSMQIENEDVLSAKKGQLIGLQVKKPVNIGTKVFKIKSQSQ